MNTARLMYLICTCLFDRKHAYRSPEAIVLVMCYYLRCKMTSGGKFTAGTPEELEFGLIGRCVKGGGFLKKFRVKFLN